MENLRELTTKELILKSAKKSFISKGYDNSRTKDIAINAGVSEALLFKYFKSKEGLFWEFQKYEIQQMERDIFKGFEDIKSPMQILLMIGKGLLEADEHTPKTICTLGEILRLHQSKFIMTFEHEEELIDEILVPIIKKGQSVGEICDTNPKELGRVYWRFILGSLMNKYHFNSKTPNTYMDIISKIFK